ncbi:MAG: c-type cytochrome [Ilumatobacteraceae bacterium]|nr:MAG: cytochrome c [Actinomycetota bacterium]
MLGASVPTSIAIVIALTVTIGWVVYFFFNRAAGRAEIGSEIELAPNRKPFLSDEELEGKHLERTQLLGVLLLAIIVVGLPLYWVFEPSRQAGAEASYQRKFVGWGAGLFETTANGGFNCAGCHGGMNATGGSADFTVTNPMTGQVRAVSWKAPALNNVFYRYSEEEVRFILVYGRPFSPMSPWGVAGGGPMNSQQIQTLIEYLKSIQVAPEGCAEGDAEFSADNDPAVCSGGSLPVATTDEVQAAAERAVEEGTYGSVGEALFNLELGSGAYSCARCHTQGWSYGDPGVPGLGAFGWNLRAGSTNAHFGSEQAMIDFIKSGSENGKQYGQQGQGTGRMPGFDGMLSDDQIKQIVDYVRSEL